MAGFGHAENHADALQVARMFHAVHTCSRPVIARVHGDAFGGGVGLAAACDVVAAAEGVGFVLSEVKLGLVAATISPHLVRAMGARHAARYMLTAEKFDGLIVTNYLHRPLFPQLAAALAPGGALIYETFGSGNERFGKPSNPDFLLCPGELLETVRGTLTVLAYENLQLTEPRPAVVQRIAAVATPWLDSSRDSA